MDTKHIAIDLCLIDISLHRAFLDPLTSSGLLTTCLRTPGSRTSGSRIR